jgi:fused signal recognition particle receptor
MFDWFKKKTPPSTPAKVDVAADSGPPQPSGSIEAHEAEEVKPEAWRDPAPAVAPPVEHSAQESSAPAATDVAPPTALPEEPVAVPAESGGWWQKLRQSRFATGLRGLFSSNPKLDDALLDDIETVLLGADVGVVATDTLVEDLRRRLRAREFEDASALQRHLRAQLLAMVRPVAKPLVVDASKAPFVILTVGVNGVGKTTTIGKLAHRFQNEGMKLALAAGDTFRAAAVEQLKVWGERNGVTVVAQGQNADAAAVIFDALQAAKSRGLDLLIADTAGRLHTQAGLMAELSKVGRVLAKIDAGAPHEVLMVIDGTTGQNAVNQVRQFLAAAKVTGLVVTKLDGSAKGGVVFALAREFGLPIRFVGLGERMQDLRIFEPEAFVDALLPELGAPARPAS